MPRADEQHRLRGVWIGAAWAVTAVVVSSAFTLVAFARELDCLFFCTEEQNETGSGFGLLVSAAAVSLVAGFVLAARASGRRGGRALGHGVLGAAALAVVLVALSSLPAVASVGAVALGVGGIVALRQPGRTLAARLVAVLAAALLGLFAGAVAGGLGEVVVALVCCPSCPSPTGSPSVARSEWSASLGR